MKVRAPTINTVPTIRKTNCIPSVGGLMVGRTPEYLGKKIQSTEVKMAVLALLVVPATILTLTSVAAVLPAGRPVAGSTDGAPGAGRARSFGPTKEPTGPAHKLPPPSVTDTFGTLPPGAVAVGRLPADTIDALWSRLRSAATSVSSATPFDLMPRSLDELKSRSPTMF
jgi:hypothetical protein